MGIGERSVIAWALVHSGFIAVLDDSAARREAQRLGVQILGTMGVVLQLRAAGIVVKVKPHLVRIRQVGGHIGETLFHEVLRRAGEES